MNPLRILLLATLATLSALAGGAHAALAPVPLGRLDPFWRYSAVLGPLLETGYALVEIPDYLGKGDFPYRKRPFAREVPFADHLSVVRLLGGYSDSSGQGDEKRDLAWRDADGKIHYRMELLRPRLQPYLDNGYTSLTIVLDNVPWCFPAKPSVGTYGQSAPPRDPEEWRQFVKALCRELSAILGPQAAGQLRFRVGTENNGRDRFNGTQEEFLRHYDASAAAVREVLPGAKVGPFNISGVSVRSIERFNVNAYALAEHCAANKVPLDWVAFSRYYRSDTDPDDYAQTCREAWEEFEKRVPSLRGVSREIHEFGFAPWSDPAKGQLASAEPGALGAALTAQITWRLRQAGINRLWHWPVTDRFRGRNGALKSLYPSHAWLLCVLDRMAGGDAFILPTLENLSGGARCLAAGSFKAGSALIMVSTWNAHAPADATQTVSLQVPAGLLSVHGADVRLVRLNRQSAVYDHLRGALAAAGLLKAEYVAQPNRIGDVRQMGQGRPAEMFVDDRLAECEKQWVDSLTLKPLERSDGTVEHDALGTTFRLTMSVPEVLVLQVQPRTQNGAAPRAPR